MRLRQKARLRPELSPKFLSTLGSNPARTQPEKRGPTYNFALSGVGRTLLGFNDVYYWHQNRQDKLYAIVQF